MNWGQRLMRALCALLESFCGAVGVDAIKMKISSD